MRIARLRINGFRGIKEADLRFGGTTVLIGPNNVGKTTIIEALALILGRDGMVRALTEHDFFGSNPREADRIKIIATIVGFASLDPAQYPEWFSIRKGGVPTWYNPETGESSSSPRPKPFQLACEIGFQARFDLGTLEIDTCRYFYDDHTTDDVFLDDAITQVNIGLVRDIGLFLVPASRSWDGTISFGSELFRRVVSSENGLPAESILGARDQLRTPAAPLEDDARLKPVITEVNAEIASLFGPGNKVHLRLTSTDSAGVLDAVVPHFGQPGSWLIPARRQGSGLVSLQRLFLLLHFGKRRIEDGKGFCLALEEPELHLPPNVQRRVLRRLKALSSQVIVSTHSPLVAGFCEPTELLVVSNDRGAMVAKPLFKKPLGPGTSNAIRTLFQLRRLEVATALMSDVVLVPEGVFDYEWLSLLSRIVEVQPGVASAGSKFAAAIGIVPTQGASVEETTKRLAEIHPRVVPLVDGDSAGQAYAKSLAEAGVRAILRWKDGWTIEDVLGWVIEPSEKEILAALQAGLPNAPADVKTLVRRLKIDDSKDPDHLKGDRIAYDVLARAIGEHPGTLARAGLVLDAVAQGAKGESTSNFVRASGANSIFIFQT